MNKSMQFASLLIATLLILLSACASVDERPTSDRYVIDITDNVRAKRFDVVISSKDDRPICVWVDNWPNDLGQLHMGSDKAKLRTGSSVLAAKDANFGYCPGGCGEHRIAPRGELRGFIAYSAFGDEDKIAASPNKHLNYFPWPYYCAK
jgi:hypothetical protein